MRVYDKSILLQGDPQSNLPPLTTSTHSLEIFSPNSEALLAGVFLPLQNFNVMVM